MKFNDYFAGDKSKATKQISEELFELDNNVEKFINSEKMPILDGDIGLYNDFMKDKQLPLDSKDPKEVYKDFSKLFQRSVLWENPGTMINITPPANIPSIVASFYTALYNPNFAQDESSGYLMTTELLVSKYLAEMADWDVKKSRGIFTFGGKGTNLYAVKMGIKKAIPDVIDNGLRDNKIVVFSNEKGHPCHREVCDWLGLGKNACIRLSTNKDGQLNIDELEKQMKEHLDKNDKVACIILNGGTTNEIIIDPIKEVVDLRDRLVKEYNLSYVPHVHVDSVIGWAWLLFKYYDFEKNEFGMNDRELDKICSMQRKISEIKYADSFGADFHKTGFCPYISSIIMAKDFNDVMGLGNKTDKGVENMKFGEYSPFEYTLELTRSSIGPVSAYAAFEALGVKGFQKALYNVFSNSEYIRSYLDGTSEFEVINLDTEGIATLFIICPPNLEKKYANFVSGDEKDLNDLIDYNHNFYLYCLKKLEEKKIHFKITFSKSYKPYGAKNPTGALKIYPTSPIASKADIKDCLDEMITLKKEYDGAHIKITEDREVPIDYVYRD